MSGDPKMGSAARTFEELAARPDESIDVALGAALLARDVYEDLDVPGLLRRFDDLAAPLRPLDLGHLDVPAQASHLARHLYEHLGFAGNEANYYDPRNSLLPDVLERRLGIPITLALVYCEVAKRAGVAARGVGFPGHFLVRIDPPAGSAGNATIIDPFFGGRVLAPEALAHLLSRVSGPSEVLRSEHLAATSARGILVRMLNNLKAVYLARGENSRALLVLDRTLSLMPDFADALRERGLLAAQLGAAESARADLARFLEMEPDAQDAQAIRAKLEILRAAPRKWN